MRTHGTLIKWNEDRGFGFIAPAQGSDEVFVHISAFAREGGRPSVGELVSFETEMGPKGQRAIRVMRGGQRAAVPHRRRETQHPNRSRGLLGTIASLVTLGAIGAYAVSRLDEPVDEPVLEPPPTVAAAAALPAPSFSCDGRTRCSEMTSCAEAQYFLQHCPNTQMDGNNDGEPCEEQWCR